ncbi:hypothetical protein MMC28_003763 [Mycoblastus sanguinarius]|nr:hypothetical protein [Mycoblastus sanguinarius]
MNGAIEPPSQVHIFGFPNPLHQAQISVSNTAFSGNPRRSQMPFNNFDSPLLRTDQDGPAHTSLSLGRAGSFESPISPSSAPRTLRSLSTRRPDSPILDKKSKNLEDLPAAFIPYNGPGTESTIKTSRGRKCMSCYSRGQCKPGPNQDCCEYCNGKNRYCRGAIEAPTLIANQSWYKMAMQSLRLHCSTIEDVVADTSIFSLFVGLNQIWPPSQLEKYDVDLRGLDDNIPNADDLTSLEKLLDMVLPAPKISELKASSQGPRLFSERFTVEPLET